MARRVRVSVPYAPTPKGKAAERRDRRRTKPVRVSVPYAPTPTGKAAEVRDTQARASAPRLKTSPAPLTPASLPSTALIAGLNTLLSPKKSLGSKLTDAMSVPVDALGDLDRRVKEASRSNPERLTTKDPTGTRTLGNVTLPQLLRAHQAGTLRTNQAGKVTIPATRQAARELKSARREVKRTQGIDGPLTQGQKRFSELVARGTGLSPRVVAAQALGEMSGPHAQRREAERNHNWLNIGYFDSGPGELTRDPTWRSPESAAKATIAFFKGERFGPSEGIRSILPKAVGKPDKAQLAAIANSGWATNSSYGPLLAGTYRSITGGKPDPAAAQRFQQAKAQAQRLGIPTWARSPEQRRAKLGNPTPEVVSRFKAAMSAAKELDAAKLPYVWGGGHGHPSAQPTGGGLDCSGAVSYVLNKMGVLKGSLVSGSMGSVLKPGPGAVTVFYNPTHTFMKIGNRYFGTSRRNPGGGAGFIEGSKPDDLSKYSVGHVPGMGAKVALQMGLDLTAGGSISYGAGGTTATVTGGTRQDRAGYADRPILPAGSPLSAPNAPALAMPEDYERWNGGEGESPDDPLASIDRLLQRRRP